MALDSFFDARGVGTHGASARVFKNNFNLIRVINENCKFLQNLCTDFLAALSVKTPWMFTVSPETRKIHHVEVKRPGCSKPDLANPGLVEILIVINLRFKEDCSQD